MPAELRAFLHDLVEAACGPGTKERLHEALDAIGKAAPVAAQVAEDVVKAAPLL
jgi:hypothetical protein